MWRYLVLLWLTLISWYDCAFALYHQDTFLFWELNPIALALGLYPVIASRLSALTLLTYLTKHHKCRFLDWSLIGLAVLHSALIGWYLGQFLLG